MRPRLALVCSIVVATAIASAVWVKRSHDSYLQIETREARDLFTGFAATAGAHGFSLVDQNGRAVTDQSFRGEWLIVFFGFTHCPAACPTTLSNLAAALDELGTRGESVRVALITVDPERDSPAVLERYLEPFGPRFVGLTGTTTQLAAATGTFRAYSQLEPAAADGAYDVQHSTYLYLVGPDGRFRRQISSDATWEQLAATLSKSIVSS